jgi:hypothetical protein
MYMLSTLFLAFIAQKVFNPSPVLFIRNYPFNRM